jgi:poly(hydroxyalkanoate) depolymerase family esterase
MRNTCLIPLATLVMACTAGGPDEGLDPDEHEDVIQQGLTQVTGFGSNPGNLQMFTYTPSGLPAGAPIVMVLHGCTQNATAMEATGWNSAANAHKLFLIYPQQQSSNNSSSCFNWFEAGDITRGQGEALSLRQMVDWALANTGADPNRVYVTGLSAGAFMAATLAAVYPEVFAGAAIHAGGPHRCATSLVDAYSCMSPGVNRTPAAWGDLVRSSYSGYTGRRPKISIWHGTSDTTVKPLNLTESMEQWTNVLGADQTADLTETIAGHTHKVYKDSAGASVVETYEIASMGHAVPVDPQFTIPGGGACGSTAAYMSDFNICAVYQQELFFGLATGTGGDTTPPSVQLTSPAAGATVSGNITLAATASDNTSVARVELLVDGAQVASDTAAPYEVTWNSASVGDGSHVVTARAVDTAGNTATSERTITTQNGTVGNPTTVSFASISAEDGYVKANADGSSPAVGTITTPAVGRGTDGKQNRSILSFDTSSLPDGATILSATVTVTYSSGLGTPWTTPAGNSLVVDVRRGTFGTSITEITDWAAAADASAAASIAAFSSGTQTSGGFSAAGLGAVNRTGRTQLRLRFTLDPTTTSYVFLGQGAASTLTVTYQ